MNPELVEVVHGRSNPGIDPVLHAWGWEVPVYLFLGGLVAGLMILLPALELAKRGRPVRARVGRRMPFYALVLLSLGMLALFLDLEYKVHVFRFYTSFEPTSPMSWGSWILLAVYPVLGLVGIGSLDAQDRKRFYLDRPLFQSLVGFAEENRRPILWASIFLGVSLGSYTGVLLGTLSARLLWGSGVMAPLFLASGVSSAAALLILCKLDRIDKRLLVRWDLIAIVAELVLLAGLVASYATGGRTERAAASTVLGGDWTPHFWGIVIVGGLVVPLLMDVIEIRKRYAPTFAGPVLILVGGLALRAVLVAAGQQTSFEWAL